MKTFIRSTNWRLGKIVAIVCAIVLAIGTKSRLDAADAESNVNVQPNILFIFSMYYSGFDGFTIKAIRVAICR